MRVFQPRRLREKKSENQAETPGQNGQKGGEGDSVHFVPEVSSVSQKNLQVYESAQGSDQIVLPVDISRNQAETPGQNGQNPTVTRLEPEPLETKSLTCWDLLRADWQVLTQEALQGDQAGRIEVHTRDGGAIVCVRLNDLADLRHALAALTSRHPEPLEVVIRAEHAGVLTLRSRHRHPRNTGRVIA